MDKLLLCPFCGGEPRMDMDKPFNTPRWVVSCTKCGGEGGPGRTAAEARNLWENCAGPARLRAEMLATAAGWAEDARAARAICDRPAAELCERAAQQLNEFAARIATESAEGSKAEIRPEIHALACAEDERVALQESLGRVGVTPETLVSEIDRDPGKAVKS